MIALFKLDGSARESSGLVGKSFASTEKERQSAELERQVTELFDQLRKPLHRYALGLSLSAGVADEVVQETFLRLFQHLRSKGSQENLRGWVFRVTHNQAMDIISSGSALKGGESQDEPFPLDALTSKQLGPEELLLQKERMSRMHAAMKTLSPQQKECLSLRSEGFRYREIAGIMGISVHTVEEHLQRAMAKLARDVRG